MRESERRAYGRAIIFSSAPNDECIFKWNDCLLRELLAWRNRKRTRMFPITAEWIYGSLFSSKFNLLRPYPPHRRVGYTPANGSLEWISHRRTQHSKQSIYKFNRAMHCNWIRGAANSERASHSLPRQRIYIPILFPGFTRARGHFRLIVSVRKRRMKE